MAPSIARSSVTSTPSKPSSRRESRIASGERPAGRSGFIRVHQVTNHDHRHLDLDGHSKTRQVPLYNGLHIAVDTKPFKMGTFECDCDNLLAALDERSQVGHDEHAVDAADGKV